MAQQTWVGIDVSGKRLDVVASHPIQQIAAFANMPAGHAVNLVAMEEVARPR